MATTPEQEYERLPPTLRIGTIDHIEAYANLASDSSINTPRELKEFLQGNSIPESLAYFIFYYQTRETRRFYTPERTAVIDTRGLTGYEPHWPVVRAEYHYEPLLYRNYIRAYGHGHHMHIPLTDGLDLNTDGNLEAHTYHGGTIQQKDVRSFRSSADPDPRYDSLRDPSLFVDVLQKTAKDLKSYLYLRDYL